MFQPPKPSTQALQKTEPDEITYTLQLNIMENRLSDLERLRNHGQLGADGVIEYKTLQEQIRKMKDNTEKRAAPLQSLDLSQIPNANQPLQAAQASPKSQSPQPPQPTQTKQSPGNTSPRFFTPVERVCVINFFEFCTSGGTGYKVYDICILLKQLKHCGVKIILLTQDKERDMEILDECDFPERYLFHNDFRTYKLEEKQAIIQSFTNAHRKGNSGKNLFKQAARRSGTGSPIPIIQPTRKASAENLEAMAIGRKSSGDGSSLLSSVLHRRTSSIASISIKSLSLVLFDNTVTIQGCSEVNEATCRLCVIDKAEDKHIAALRLAVSDFKRLTDEKTQKEKEEENLKRKHELTQALKELETSQDLLRATFWQLYTKARWGFVGEMANFFATAKDEQNLTTAVSKLLPKDKFRIDIIPDSWNIYEALSRCMLELNYCVDVKVLKQEVFRYVEQKKGQTESWVKKLLDSYKSVDQVYECFAFFHNATDEDIRLKNSETMYSYIFINWNQMDLVCQIIPKIYPGLRIHIIFPTHENLIIHYMIDVKGITKIEKPDDQFYKQDRVIHIMRYDRPSEMSNIVSYFLPVLTSTPILSRSTITRPPSDYQVSAEYFISHFDAKMKACISADEVDHVREFNHRIIMDELTSNTIFVKPVPGTDKYVHFDFRQAEESSAAAMRFRTYLMQVLAEQSTEIKKIKEKCKTIGDFLGECFNATDAERNRLWDEWQLWIGKYAEIDSKRIEYKSELAQYGKVREINTSMVIGNSSVTIEQSRDLFMMAKNGSADEFRRELIKIKRRFGDKFDIHTFGRNPKVPFRSVFKTACAYGNGPIVTLLLNEEKVDVNHQLDNFDPPAIFDLTEFLASDPRNIAVLTTLLNAGADPNSRYNNRYQTATHFAACKGSAAISEVYLSRGTLMRPGSVNFYTVSRVDRKFGELLGHRAIYEAILSDQFNVVQMYYSYGVELKSEEIARLMKETGDNLEKLMCDTDGKARISEGLIKRLKENPNYLIERMIEVLRQKPEYFKRLASKFKQGGSRSLTKEKNGSGKDLRSPVKDLKLSKKESRSSVKDLRLSQRDLHEKDKQPPAEESFAPEECSKAEMVRLENAWIAKLSPPDSKPNALSKQRSSTTLNILGSAVTSFFSSDTKAARSNSGTIPVSKTSMNSPIAPVNEDALKSTASPSEGTLPQNVRDPVPSPQLSPPSHRSGSLVVMTSKPPASPTTSKGGSVIVAPTYQYDKLDFESCDESTGLSILHLAIIIGNEQLFNIAVDKAPLRSMCSKYGCLPTYYAAKYRRSNFLVKLLEKDALLTPKEEVIKHLIEVERNVDKSQKKLADYNRNPLHAAIEIEDPEMVKQLLNYALRKNDYTCIYGQDSKGHSPLMKALFKKNKEILRLFRAKGIWVIDKHDVGVTLAQMEDQEEVQSILKVIEEMDEEIIAVLEKAKVANTSKVSLVSWEATLHEAAKPPPSNPASAKGASSVPKLNFGSQP